MLALHGPRVNGDGQECPPYIRGSALPDAQARRLGLRETVLRETVLREFVYVEVGSVEIVYVVWNRCQASRNLP